jgi:type II secretion system protein N
VTALRLLVAAATFAASLALFFPTDLLARRLLAAAIRPGGPTLAFAEARLRPGGLLLADVTLRRADGTALVQAPRVRLRPSLAGLVRNGRGLPWRIEAEACGGTGDATVAATGPTASVTLVWRDADLAACPPLALAATGLIAGRAHGRARLALTPGSPPEGDGRVALVAATWRGEGPAAMLGALHAATASLRWRLQDGRVLVEALDVAGPEISIAGTGELRLADPWAESDLDLRLALAPAAQAPQLLRLLLGGPAAGRRELVLAGTLARPRAVLQ